ncbi:MAG TPA: (d)CMP kinase [Solirubrobacteraceae bacterium]|jgi:cytidylate kinase|nr:(d)CMP kinase [Solirubrobacteraceae bacterium]
MVVAIDGPAGAGKSTVARAVALALGFTYLDSGAMYRCVALAAIRAPGVEPARLAAEAHIELGAAADATGRPVLDSAARAAAGGRVWLDGHDVSAEIRSPEVSEMASRVATDPGVRAALVAKQRELLARGDWVAEGRDIGTVVAPAAELKIFLTADPRERARRRAAELGADVETVLAEQTLRDQRDSTREHSPLAPARGAVAVDTSGLTVAEVVARIAARLPGR